MTSTAPATAGTSPTARRAITAAAALVHLLAAATAMKALLQTLIYLNGSNPLVFGGADGRVSLSDLPQLLQASPRSEVAQLLYLGDLPLWLRALSVSPYLVAAVTAVAAAVLLGRVLRAVRTGAPFTAPAVGALKVLAVVLLGGAIAQGLLGTAAVLAISHVVWQVPGFTSAYTGIGTDVPHWPLTTAVLGLLAIAAHTAFRHGQSLQDPATGAADSV